MCNNYRSVECDNFRNLRFCYVSSEIIKSLINLLILLLKIIKELILRLKRLFIKII